MQTMKNIEDINWTDVLVCKKCNKVIGVSFVNIPIICIECMKKHNKDKIEELRKTSYNGQKHL